MSNGTDTQPCPACNGAAVVPNPSTNKMDACPVCLGCGQVEADYDYQFYVYPFQPPQLTANQANLPSTIQIDTDADFKLYQIVGTSTGTYKVQMQEPAKGNRLWMSAPIDSRNWLGTAQLPSYLYIPYVMKRQQLYTLFLTDTSGAPNLIEIGFMGYKLWPKS